jgi:hypothetical protein
MPRKQSAAARAPPSLPRQANGESVAALCIIHTSQTVGGILPQSDPKEGVTMKKLMVILLASYALVISQGVREVIADEEEPHGLPLSALAGTYAATFQGSIVFCFQDTPPFPPAKCGSTGSTGVPFSLLQVGAVTRDTKGNACATLTETLADLLVNTSPPFVLVIHTVGKVTSYDPTTGTGDVSVTIYSGGKCKGTIFDSTGATVQATTTSHFAASNHGKRVDFISTSATNSVGSIGGFSSSGTQQRH